MYKSDGLIEKEERENRQKERERRIDLKNEVWMGER